MSFHGYSDPAEIIDSYRGQVAQLRRELEEAREKLTASFLSWRHVDEPCTRCRGAGVLPYGDTSTWRRGGLAGQRITVDVCDQCWGTGDAHRTGANIRELQAKHEALLYQYTACHAEKEEQLVALGRQEQQIRELQADVESREADIRILRHVIDEHLKEV